MSCFNVEFQRGGSSNSREEALEGEKGVMVVGRSGSGVKREATGFVTDDKLYYDGTFKIVPHHFQ